MKTCFMTNKRTLMRYIFGVIFLLSFVMVKGQVPVSAFSSNTTSGCAALTVNFTDKSTGSPKFWNWDFGNGQLSNQQNPTAVFHSPGKYTVTLVVRNADGTDGHTETDYITVYPSPAADFISNITTTCLPGIVQFTDKSIANAGTINKWEWDFGDGTTSTQQNPVKTYNSTGFYTVSLKV